VFFFSFSCTFVSGIVSPVFVPVVVVVVVVVVVEAVVVGFLLPLSTFANFVAFTGLVAFVVDLTGFEDVAFTGFGGLLVVVLTETGFTDAGFVDFDTDVWVGLGGLTGFGLGPP
jgi:hypothetical protein